MKRKKRMTPEEFEQKMKEIEAKLSHDPEAKHGQMDDLLCLVLSQIGYQSGVKIFEAAEKY